MDRGREADAAWLIANVVAPHVREAFVSARAFDRYALQEDAPQRRAADRDDKKAKWAAAKKFFKGQ